MNELIADSSEKNKARPALSGWPMVIGWIAMLIFAAHACTRMVGAGDTWVAMSCGRHFLNHGVNTVEPFSANSHKAGPTKETMAEYAKLLRTEAGNKKGIKYSLMRWWSQKCENYENWPQWKKSFTSWIHPTGWINQNWLTHVIFYSLVPKSTYTPSDTFSSNALVYWKFAIYILTVICVYYTTRLLGVNSALAAAFACFAIFTGRSYFDIRPAGFSNLLVAVYLLVLVLTTYKNILYIWLIVPITIFWCNVHGGYVYLFIMLVLFVAFHFLSTFVLKNRFVSIGRRGIYHTIAAGFAALIAMIIFNPFHLTNLTHTFVISISKHAEMWRNVNEWHPAFEWSNPVGTTYPFFIMFVLSIAVVPFWLFSRFLKPRLLKAPKSRLELQQNIFNIQIKIFGIAAAFFLCWCSFLSFSFINYDLYSFAVCALFTAIVLFSVYKNVHFIYAFIPFMLLTLWSSMDRPGYAGRYIYPVILLPAYFIINSIASLLSKKVKLKPLNLVFVASTAFASFVLMIFIFNPFKFAMPNWHFEKADSLFANIAAWFRSCFDWAYSRFIALKYLPDARVMWRPKFINNAEPSYQNLFPVLYVINILVAVIWLACPYLKEQLAQLSNNTELNPKTQNNEYQLPKIDLALIAIAALSIYMAVRMRRFVPTAAIAACPVLALFIQHIIHSLSASVNFHKKNKLVIPSMPRGVQNFFIIVAAAVTVFLGTCWILKFKYVYLDPWPTDNKLTSVFMRMTASDAKPFYALKFIKDNKLEGNMFNYWTEGGFIAWGQKPDPKTGKTPLQLFMDGRAQAAYEPDAYTLWSYIMSGGPHVRSAKMRNNPVDYQQVGQWLDSQLRKYGVWVALMPVAQFDSPFVKGLESHPDWIIIFFNNKQKLFVYKNHPQAKRLFNGIFTGETIYPDQFSKNLILAYYKIGSTKPDERKEGLELAIKACEEYPSQAPVQRILYAARYNELRPIVEEYCKKYFEDFAQNKDKYKEQHAYHDRIAAALVSCKYLYAIENNLKNKEKVRFYVDKIKQLDEERVNLLKGKRW